jgi:hypothetical protein
MQTKKLTVRNGPKPRTVLTESGKLLSVPAGWELLPPGDAALTRQVKTGPHWAVQETKGRRKFSRGIWAPAATIASARQGVEAMRNSPTYQLQREAQKQRRDRKQSEYVEDFQQAVVDFLHFAPSYAGLASQLAEAVSRHATPVGSGTVARTARIPIEQRAEAAVIAWMRHQTTAYDRMVIPRIKGKRREARRLLAGRSRELLDTYRRGLQAPDACPLQNALQRAASQAPRSPAPKRPKLNIPKPAKAATPPPRRVATNDYSDFFME